MAVQAVAVGGFCPETVETYRRVPGHVLRNLSCAALTSTRLPTGSKGHSRMPDMPSCRARHKAGHEWGVVVWGGVAPPRWTRVSAFSCGVVSVDGGGCSVSKAGLVTVPTLPAPDDNALSLW